MRKHPIFFQIGLILWLLIISLVLNVTAKAGFPEPDTILFGTVSGGEKLYTQGKIFLKSNGSIISNAEIVNETSSVKYILRIPVDGEGPPNDKAVKPGEMAELFFGDYGYMLEQTQIREKGRAFQLDFIIPDSDDDGLNDADELKFNTKKNNPDTDGDGLQDGWEIAWGFDPVGKKEGYWDSDNDGLSNLQEQNLGTHPKQEDTDGDGCTDAQEAASNRNPLINDPEGDINEDCKIDLADLILSLGVVTGYSGIEGNPKNLQGSDANKNLRIDMIESIFILQKSVR